MTWNFALMHTTRPPGVLFAAATTTLVAGLDNVLTVGLPLLVAFANLSGGIVVGIALVRALLTYLRDLLRNGGEAPQEAIRLSLGRSLSLALEFQLAADILGTALDPTRDDLIVLGAVAALRTALNYFLGRELDQARLREREAPDEP